MDRKIVYPGQIPLETDLLGTEKNAYVGLSQLMLDILGSGPLIAGFAVTATGPASMNVNIAAGRIYAGGQTLDNTDYSSLGTDSAVVVKQGQAGAQNSSGLTNGNFPAPGTAGQSINYLIQVGFQTADTGATVLPYYNSSNPSQAWNGPDGDGSSQATTRADQAIVSIVAGTAATTGTQTTPSPSAGCVGAYVVTVANGQTTITSGNIAVYNNAAGFLGSQAAGLSLNNLAPLVSPAFSGTPTVPTQALLDNSSKAASTQFVQQNAGGMAGVTSITGATTLTNANAGQLIAAGGSGGYTVTLAAVSAMPAGKGFKLVNISTGTITVDAAGSDSIQLGASSVSGLTLGPGDVVELYSDNTSAYQVADNTLTKIGALATVVFDGTGTGTLTPIRSQNVTSVVKSGTGEYIITVPFNWPSGTPCMAIMVKQATGSHGYSLGPGDSYTCGEVSFTSNSVTIVTRAEGLDNNGVGSSNQADVSYISVIFF